MMFPREKHRRFATIDESGRIEFGFAEGEKKKEHAETTIVSIGSNGCVVVRWISFNSATRE